MTYHLNLYLFEKMTDKKGVVEEIIKYLLFELELYIPPHCQCVQYRAEIGTDLDFELFKSVIAEMDTGVCKIK